MVIPLQSPPSLIADRRGRGGRRAANLAKSVAIE